jgi:ectoine hydroxylase-related dioxygenase (phytanoyl-CoA dioxygenase family)
MTTKEQIEQYRNQGYFIADDAVEPDMLESLVEAARRARDKVRSGQVVADPDKISTGGPGVEAHVISGLIAPEFSELIFAEYLISKPVESYAQAFLGEELRLGWVGLFAICGPSRYDTGWHRDFGKEERDGSEEVELEILSRYRKNLLKWHMALVDDPCLWVVPGSQRRYRTDHEREVLINNRQDDIPGQQQIRLKKGQTIFWNGNIIHRGRMPAHMEERLTQTGSLIKYQKDDLPEELDERYRWRLADNIRDNLPGKMQLYYDRWRVLQKV